MRSYTTKVEKKKAKEQKECAMEQDHINAGLKERNTEQENLATAQVNIPAAAGLGSREGRRMPRG